MEFKAINPATEETTKTYTSYTKNQITAYIDSADISFQSWRKTSFEQRRNRMLKLAEILRERQAELAKLMATEMGKPVCSGKNEIEKCAWVCEHYAAQAESYLAPRLIPTQMQKTEVCYQPLGIIFAIMPWNFPFWQVFRFAAPNIMAGNVAILKHAPICFGTGNRIAELFLEAGFPEHLFQHFVIGDDIAADVIANPKVRGVTLTGSDRAGKAVASQAGKYLKKVVLELGGNDPYVVLGDADLDLAAEKIVQSRMNNTGQVCIAAKRVIVVPESIDELSDIIKDKLIQYEMGDPLSEETNFGPMAREDLRETVHSQVKASEEQGADILLGGHIPDKKGYYYPPTLLVNVQPGMPAFDEEVFGPVVAISRANDEQHAIKLANQSPYGLGAAIFTRDLERGEKLAKEDVITGSCFVNEFVASDPRVPFGGIKCSGFGRELSREGILEFVNTKTVSIK